MKENRERIEKLKKDMRDKLDKYGWRVDAVVDDACDTGTGVDIHTHGLAENFDHKDIECVLPVRCLVAPEDEDIFVKVIYGVFEKIFNRIKNGEKFKAGKCYSGILGEDLKVRFLDSHRKGRDLLRIIMPDEQGKLHQSLVEDVDYRMQFNIN